MSEQKVLIYGAGKVGRGLAGALRGAGYQVTLRPQRKGLPTRPIEAALIIVAVRDRDIAPTAEALRDRRLVGHRRVAIVHCAGSQGPEALAAARGPKVAVAQMHPMISFASPRFAPTLTRGQLHVDGDAAAVRREWLAAQALPDVERVDRMAAPGVELQLDPDLRRYATNDADGQIHIHAWPSHAVETVLPSIRWESGKPVRVFAHGFAPVAGFYGASYWNRMFVVWPLDQAEAPIEGRSVRFRLPSGARAGVSIPGPTLRLGTDSADGAMHLFDAQRGVEVGAQLIGYRHPVGHQIPASSTQRAQRCGLRALGSQRPQPGPVGAQRIGQHKSIEAVVFVAG